MKKKINSYMTRALKSRDPRYAKILGKLGYDTAEMKVDDVKEDVNSPEEEVVPENSSVEIDEAEQLKSARVKYEETFGKKPFYGWSKEVLLDKIEKANDE